MKFLKSVWKELKMVVWPTGKQWRKDVLVVLEMTLIFAAFFALTDFGLSHAVAAFLK